MNMTNTPGTTTYSAAHVHGTAVSCIEIGFDCGTGAAYRLLRHYATDPEDSFTQVERKAAQIALTILERHEVELAEAFDPEDHIMPEGYEEEDEGDF